MSGVLGALLDLLFPPRCPFCGKLLRAGEGGLCAKCQEALPWLTGSQGEQRLEFVSCCVSPLRYQGEVRRSIHRYKFEGIRGYAGVYGTLIAQCVSDRLAGRYDLITWVPLSPKRRRERGYDQAMLLARAVAAALDGEAVETLSKVRHTDAQSGLKGEAERRANVLGVYEILDGEALAGRKILLIDDVATTGATLSECARILRTAGAEDVVCATLARAR